MAFTKEQKGEYVIRQGKVCPYCKEDQSGITLTESWCHIDNKLSHQAECKWCGKTWQKHYLLMGRHC